MHWRTQSCGLSGRIVSTARSTSSSVPPPVERSIGLPKAATCRRSGVLTRSRGGDLERGRVELCQEVGARLVERRREERDAFLAAGLAELEPVARPTSSSASRCSPYVAPKLFSLSYGASYSSRVKSARLSRFWSLTASTPHSFAAWISAFACSTSPWWLCPISAMTYAAPSSRDRLAVDDQLAHGPDGTQDSGPEPPSASR